MILTIQNCTINWYILNKRSLFSCVPIEQGGIGYHPGGNELLGDEEYREHQADAAHHDVGYSQVRVLAAELPQVSNHQRFAATKTGHLEVRLHKER